MIPEYLVRLGPFMAPVLYLLLALAAWLACRLTVAGIRQRSAWRMVVAAAIALYLAAVAISGVLS